MILLEKKQSFPQQPSVFMEEALPFYGSSLNKKNTDVADDTSPVFITSTSGARRFEALQRELDSLQKTWEKSFLFERKSYAGKEILSTIHSLCEEGRIKKAVLHLYREVNGLLCAGKFEEVSFLLRLADLEDLPPELLVGLLRITFPARQKILDWKATCRKVSNELTRRGFDSSVLLVGLPY